jgi:uncharacterized Zn-binding protein involved in type VI secretion
MGQRAAKQGDRIEAQDTLVTGPPPGTVTLPFRGLLSSGLSATVRIMGRPAATVGSTATNLPPFAGSFPAPPSNLGTVLAGSATVRINGRPAARDGDAALTCNQLPAPFPPIGRVAAGGTVSIG